MDVFGRRTSGHRAHEGPLTGHKIVNSFRYAIAFERHAGETFKAATHCTGGGWKRPMHIVCKERRPVDLSSQSCYSRPGKPGELAEWSKAHDWKSCEG